MVLKSISFQVNDTATFLQKGLQASAHHVLVKYSSCSNVDSNSKLKVNNKYPSNSIWKNLVSSFSKSQPSRRNSLGEDGTNTLLGDSTIQRQTHDLSPSLKTNIVSEDKTHRPESVVHNKVLRKDLLTAYNLTFNELNAKHTVPEADATSCFSCESDSIPGKTFS